MNALIKKENNTSEFHQFIKDELDKCESIMLGNDYSNANRALNWFDMKNKES